VLRRRLARRLGLDFRLSLAQPAQLRGQERALVLLRQLFQPEVVSLV
jgi:hypothetical protein